MIILIRGTNGAGKTHAVRMILNLALMRQDAPFDSAHGSSIIRLPAVRQPIVVIGPYVDGRSMGGSDCIRSHKDIYRLINESVKAKCHVIVENVQIAARPFFQMQQSGKDVRLVLIDPPLSTCFANIQKRQQARGRVVRVSKTAMLAKQKKAWSMFREASNHKRVTETHCVRGGEQAARKILTMLRSA